MDIARIDGIQTHEISRLSGLRKACGDFEAIFLEHLLQSMRKTVGGDGLFSGGRAEELFTAMQDQAIAGHVAGQNGIGLSRMLYAQLQRYVPQGQEASSRQGGQR